MNPRHRPRGPLSVRPIMQAAPSVAAPVPVMRDKGVYRFNADHEQPSDQPRKSNANTLLHHSSLLSQLDRYAKDIEPHMYTLVHYMPGIPPRLHTLFAGQSIEAGQSELSTGTGVYAIIEDGNFAIYMNDDRLWQTDTLGSAAQRLTMHKNGRLVLSSLDDAEIWSAAPEDPQAKPPFKCQLRSDGNLAILDLRNTIAWDTKSSVPSLHAAAIRHDMESTLFEMTQQHLLSMRAIHALKPTDISSAFKLQAVAEPVAPQPIVIPLIPSSHDTPPQFPEAQEHSRKAKKQKKEKKEKKHKKDKHKDKHHVHDQ